MCLKLLNFIFLNTWFYFKVHNLTTKLEQTKNKLDEECQINSALQKNQNEWHLKFSNLEKDFNTYKSTKDQVNILWLIHCFICLNF